jgi:murein DD-endopeptidase MepM/ murein hydrolase activator NlpD
LGSALLFFWFFLKSKKITTVINNVSIPILTLTPTTQPTKEVEKIYPVAEFNQRITKKPFGIYITPQDSPVQPERFTGFHTGVDVEYGDVTDDVPVFAVCDGDIVLGKWVSGYGGTVVLKCQINNLNYYVLYGHLRAASITGNIKVLKGDKIAVLGDGYTQETDFERKHLHFSIHKNSMDLRGYVQKQSELVGWIDPLTANLF